MKISSLLSISANHEAHVIKLYTADTYSARNRNMHQKKFICRSRKKIVVENPQVCTQQSQTTILVRVLTSQTGAIYCSNWSDMKEIEIHDKGRQTTMHLNTFFFSFFHPNINFGYFLSIPCHLLCRHQFNFYIHNCLALR